MYGRAAGVLWIQRTGSGPPRWSYATAGRRPSAFIYAGHQVLTSSTASWSKPQAHGADFMRMAVCPGAGEIPCLPSICFLQDKEKTSLRVSAEKHGGPQMLTFSFCQGLFPQLQVAHIRGSLHTLIGRNSPAWFLPLLQVVVDTEHQLCWRS